MKSRAQKMQSLDTWYWQLEACDDAIERARKLDELRAQDEAAARELEKMLAVAADAEGFMSLPRDSDWSSSSMDRVRDVGTDSTSRQIGPYKLLEPIGEGGMGIVYLAQQTQPVRRKVAIKVIKPGMDSRQVIARFEAERQALALMEHPHIAKVLDAGTTERGLPYFVMELVRGIAITEYCDTSKMNIRERLALFVTACSAIQHAHNKGIIHRDIKPSNVLVTEHDGSPVVKVIDFGVAKALTDDLTNKTLYTGLFQMIGTPLYMSPEQASLSGLDVDTRSDVYSLGVLLYELVSGMLPLDKRTAQQMSFEQLRDHICNTEPERPSKRLSSAIEHREVIAQTRGLRVSQLAKTIDRELDWIVMRSIEKDRKRRFQSPRELAADISRFLDGEPVEACPPTWTYRGSKLLKRHRRSFAVVAIVLMSLTAATAISTHQALKATKASDLAIHNAGVAEQKAAELTEFVYARDMVSASDLYLNGEQAEFQRVLQRHEAPDQAYLKGYEWRFLGSLRPVKSDTLFECEHRINDFVVDSASQRAILCDSGGNLHCIDLLSGTQLAAFKSDNDPILAIDLSVDRQLSFVGASAEVATSQLDESLDLSPERRVKLGSNTLLSLASTGDELWVGNDKGEVFAMNSSETLQVPADFRLKKKIMDLVQATDGSVLAAHTNEILELRTETSGRLRRPPWRLELNRTSGSIRDLDLHHEMGLLVSAQSRGGIALFRLTDAEPQQLFTHLLPDDLHSVAISDDGSWIAAGDASGHLHLVPTHEAFADSFLDIQTARERQMKSWNAHEGKIEHVAFCKADDGEYQILSAGRDGRLVVSRPFHQSSVSFLSVDDCDFNFPSEGAKCELLWHEVQGSLDRGDARFSNGHIGKWSVALDLSLREIADEGLAVLIDGRRLVVIPKHGDSASTIWLADDDSKAMSFAISRDGSHFALCRERSLPKRHTVEIYSKGTTDPRHTIRSNLANRMVFSPHGHTLAYIWNNEVAVVEAASGKRLHLLKSHTDSVRNIRFSPDGKRIASVSNDRRLAVWDVASGELLWTQRAHRNRATDVAFHPTLPTLATVGADAYIRFWSTREEVSDDSVRFVGEYPLNVGNCSSVTFSDDGSSLFVFHAPRGVSILTTQTVR